MIPFASVTQFSDPSVGFGLQFGILDDIDIDGIEEPESMNEAQEQTPKSSDESAEIVSLDTFRNRPKSDS